MYHSETNRKEHATLFYSACWTDSGFLLSCWHDHTTVHEAAKCIHDAGGYVVAIEQGVMRALTQTEELEFDRAMDTLHPERATPLPETHGAHKRPEFACRPQWREGGSLFDFTNRVMDAYGYPPPPSTVQVISGSAVVLTLLIDFIEFVLNWINSWEVSELERLHGKQVATWLEALREKAHGALNLSYDKDRGLKHIP